MPPKPRPWFRFYVEAFHDPKLRRLTAAQRWLWVAILGAARKSCRPGYLLVSESQPMDQHDLADLAAMQLRDVRRALPLFEQSGMIEQDPDSGAWRVTRWSERQYESDDVTKRTRKHRSNVTDETFQRRSDDGGWNGATSSDGTPPDTETETDTSRGGTTTHEAPVAGPPPHRCKKHSKLPADADVPPCGPCADARRRLEAWRAARPAPEPDRADRRMEAQQAAVRARADAYTPDPTRPDPELNVSQIQAIRDKAHLPSRAALNGQETP